MCVLAKVESSFGLVTMNFYSYKIVRACHHLQEIIIRPMPEKNFLGRTTGRNIESMGQVGNKPTNNSTEGR